MKFLSLLTLASFALAVPAPASKPEPVPELVPRQQQTAVGTIVNQVGILNTTTQGNIDAITTAVAQIQGAVGVDVIANLQAIIRANLQDIADAVGNATTAITGSTTGAVGGVAGAIIGLTQQQVGQLTAAIQASIQVINQISVVITLVTNLPTAIRVFFDAEIQAVKDTLAPFIAPIAIFASAITSASVFLGVVVTGLRPALVDLLEIYVDLVSRIGITPDSSIPAVSAIAAL
ncbi:hypothetical protein CEP52_007603 [Fusarium oligoseptatum]|uniref:Uncharacterized protein n=1 Tax=Fusarium oligoseptatum TaxID=2604345 RepID=A0A428TM43_9HYPO|nr:hypothetical protein CEP52_007603 [Fusarium oligoseptatum]